MFNVNWPEGSPNGAFLAVVEKRQGIGGYFFVFSQKNVRDPEGLDLVRAQWQTANFANGR